MCRSPPECSHTSYSPSLDPTPNLYLGRVGIGNSTRQFWFVTPPRAGPDVPYTFRLTDSTRTLTHYELSQIKGQTVLHVGDLWYADDCPFHDNIRWDTWGRFTERSAAYQPWIWTAGNHEIDFAPDLLGACGLSSINKLYHGSDLNSHVNYKIYAYKSPAMNLGKYTPQYKWLANELPKVNRTETPWLIVLIHCPIYIIIWKGKP
ncbi:Purple acid phosphatase 2 [Vitis vinifera]|uniref:acid phosphatase n=1 Tax=Vitis vinifera TaxID=29760 RepID=A0A438H7Q9_VITVI|nr:Purple acid phosphatase 2 [Vitis vinifera]